MTDLPRAAIDHAPLLAAIRDGGHATMRALASAGGLPNDNHLAKYLRVLEAEGLVERGPTGDGFPQATELAARALHAIAVFDGSMAPPAGYLALRADQLRESPLNARQVFSQEEIDALGETMASHTLQQPIKAQPAGPDGVHEIDAGARRLRAWRRNIERGLWPADHLEIVKVEALGETERLEVNLIENVQRVELNHVELAQACDRLVKAGRSNRQIATLMGSTIERVQQHLRILALAPDQLAKMSLPRDHKDFLSLHSALGLLRPAKEVPALELTAKLAVTLAEIAHAGEVSPATADVSEPGYTRMARAPTGGPISTLLERKLLSYRLGAGETAGNVYLKVLVHSTDAGKWLEQVGFEVGQPLGPTRIACLLKLRSAVVGEMLAASLHAQGRYVTEDLNLPAPEARTSWAERSSADQAAAIASGRDAPAETLQASPAPAAPASPPTPQLATDGIRLTATDRRIIIELAHAIRMVGVSTQGGLNGCDVDPGYDRQPNVSALVMEHRMLQFVPGPAGRIVATLSPTAQHWFNDQGYPRDAKGPQVTDADLYDIRMEELGEDRTNAVRPGQYVTPWLNLNAPAETPAAEPEAPRPTFQSPLYQQIKAAQADDDDDDEDAAEEPSPVWDLADKTVRQLCFADWDGFRKALIALEAASGNPLGELRSSFHRAGIDFRALERRIAKDSPEYYRANWAA